MCLTVLALMAVVVSVSGRSISRQVSSSGEISGAKSREIALPDVIRKRCRPVPHDVLWLRLNVAPQLPVPVRADTVLARGPQAENIPSYNVLPAADRQPEVDINFRSHGGEHRRRYRRNTRESRRRQRRRQQRQHHKQQRHSRKHSRRRDLLARLSDGEAWRCHMTSYWLRMPDDVFPPYVQTGNCTRSRCMLGLYECRARKYATRILRRLAGACNPLPVTGDVTEGAGFEEAWVAKEYHVTVACECSKRRASGWYDGVTSNSMSDSH